jgi:hypothetical protein
MKLYLRHHNQIIANPTLDITKTYSVGRGLNCDIQIPISNVSRYQGVIFFEEGKWHFRNEAHPDKPVVTLSDSVSVNLKNGLEIFLDTFLANESTHIGEIAKTKSHTFEKSKHIWKWALAFTFVLLIGAGSSYIYYLLTKPFDSKTLMGFAENKILKFELKVKKDVIDKIKKEADLKEDDFKETVGFCTGFLVEKNVLLTAHHCVSTPPGMSIEKDFILKTFDNREILPKRILGFDFMKDYLFLEIEGFNDNPSFKITDTIEIGQKVFTIGNVAGEGLAIREGIISGETEDQNDPTIKYIRFSAAASPGNSGGPLLNERGEVVALVSRKNMAENYNVGISYKDLRNGFNNFVLNRDKKEIIFDSKASELTYGGIEYHLAKIFKLPLLERLENKPHLQEVLNKFIVKFEVPFEFKDSYQLYFSKFHEVAKEKIFEVSQLTRKENLPGLEWENQTTKDLPYIIPSATSDNNITFKLLDENHMVPKTLGLIGNSGQMGYDVTLSDWKKEKIYYYNEGFMATKGLLLEERIPNSKQDNYLVYSSVKDTKEALDISKYFVASPDFSIQYLTSDFDLEKRNTIIQKTMKDIFIGPEGAIVSLRYFPFLRPKAKADFKVKDFPAGIKKVKTFQDKNKRSWDYYVADFYDAFYVELFCVNNPTTTHCLTTFQEGSLDRMKEETVKNFVNFELNEKFSIMDFYTTTELKNEEMTQYFKFNQPLSKFNVSKDMKNNLKVKLMDFDYELNLGKENDILSLRFIPGIKHVEKENKGEWSSFGVQFVKKSKGKNPKETVYELCTAGVHFEELKYNAMLTKDQLLQKSFRGIASEFQIKNKNQQQPKLSFNKDTVWKKDLGPDERNWKKQAYGTCQTLEKDPEKPDTFRTEYEAKLFKAE